MDFDEYLHKIGMKDKRPCSGNNFLSTQKKSYKRFKAFWDLAEKDNFRCYLCGIDLKLQFENLNKFGLATRDHVTPKSKGGVEVRLCCWNCNQKKKDLI